MMNGGHMGSFGNGGFNGYNGMQQGFNSFDMMAGGSLMTMLVFVLIAFTLYLIFKNKKQQTSVSSNMGNSTVIEAEEVAKLRYARGEITHEEFQSILKTIKF
ncbi:SHOCT domain-containing protein [Virgibacillus sp. MG-45]|uniref:SHOCT domain-containing protein n=1 Tax=Virgibacillus sp. MG-45 TaxID=3102791 RepID=UPI002EDB00F1